MHTLAERWGDCDYGSTPVKVSANLSGLAANTTYYCPPVATMAAGSAVGADRIFKTN